MSKKSQKSETKTRTEMFKQPFPHMLVNNFLSAEVYKKTFEIYNKLQFKQKISDLFHFFQTYELNKEPKLKYFQDELDKQFWRLPPMCDIPENKNKKQKNGQKNQIKKQDTFYNIFASYYFKGDYLLCHDDVIEDRLYAFSYYLEDHDSADLVLFNKNANKEVKRIHVKKNTLAIFQVSDISYHEVDLCMTDGRKAITGWFNIKGLGDKRKWKTIPQYIPTVPSNSLKFSLGKDYLEQQYFQLPQIQYQFNVTKCEIEGPFFSRRVHKIEITPRVIFELEGYKILSAEFYNFKQGDYLLLNDPINKIPNQQNIIDVFVTQLSSGFAKSELIRASQNQNQDDDDDGEGNVLVKIVQEDEQPSGIPELDDYLFIVHRAKKQYYVDRVPEGKEFMLAHFMYVPEPKKSAGKDKKKKQQKIKKKPSKNKQIQKQAQNIKNKQKNSKKKTNKKKIVSTKKSKSPGASKQKVQKSQKPKEKSVNTRKIKKTK